MEKKLRRADFFFSFDGGFGCKGLGWVAALEKDGLRGERGPAGSVGILLSLSAGIWRTLMFGSFEGTVEA